MRKTRDADAATPRGGVSAAGVTGSARVEGCEVGVDDLPDREGWGLGDL